MSALFLTDRPEIRPDTHNYVRALFWLRAQGKIPNGFNKMDVYHDSWCDALDGQRCNCVPIIKVDGKRIKYPAKVLEAERGTA